MFLTYPFRMGELVTGTTVCATVLPAMPDSILVNLWGLPTLSQRSCL